MGRLEDTLPNSSHLKSDGWNTILSFWGPAYFQGLFLFVFREGNLGGGFKYFLFLSLFTIPTI